MKIRMLEDHEAALDGVNIETYREGAAYLIPDDLAAHWIDEDIAEEDAGAGPIENTSVPTGARENTSQQAGGQSAGADGSETKDDGATVDAAALKKMTKPQLVAHAAALDPPLTLDEASKKDQLLAAIDAHEPAAAPTGDDDAGGQSAGGDGSETKDDGAATS